MADKIKLWLQRVKAYLKMEKKHSEGLISAVTLQKAEENLKDCLAEVNEDRYVLIIADDENSGVLMSQKAFDEIQRSLCVFNLPKAIKKAMDDMDRDEAIEQMSNELKKFGL